MSIQNVYSIVFTILLIVQIICAIQAFRSEKTIGKYAGKLNIAIMIPILANIIIIQSTNKLLSEYAYYISYIGMTIILMALVYFSTEYCKGVSSNKKYGKPIFLYVLGGLDILQIMLAPILHHVCNIEEIMLANRIYYIDIPLFGLTLHRIVDYMIFGCTLLLYIVCAAKTSKLYREKFIVIIIVLITAGISQFSFITTRTPIDKSILIHGVVGFIVFYFSIIYRPLRLLDTLLSNITSNRNDSIYIFDSTNKCIWANTHGYNLLNQKPGSDSIKLKDSLIEKFGNLHNDEDSWSKDIYISNTKQYYTIEKGSVHSYTILDGYYYIITDVTDKHNQVEKELYESTHDQLTGLYNSQYLYYYIKKTIASNRKRDYYAIYINIKNFKMINDVFGPKFGDKVLQSVSNWIKDNFSDDEILYGRLVGDTFGIFIPVEKFDDYIFINDFNNYIVQDRKIKHQICIHIGIYKIPTSKIMEPSVIFDRAHIAITGLTEYKTILKYYNDEMRSSIIEEQKLITDLPKAIEENQIIPYIQPILDREGKIVGGEALARWNHPDLGFLQPAKFISIFEKSGYIIDVDRHIWEQSCVILQQLKEINDKIFISINISPNDFYFLDVVSYIKELTNKYEINPKNLRIEITETAMIDNANEKIKMFENFRKEGFIVEMDDFGSGYSSLNILKDIPLDVLKLDMKFLSNNSEKSTIIIKNIINLSNELSIITLTEGVETKEDVDMLLDNGCILFQGYYFDKPMSVNEFINKIKGI